MKSPSKSAPVIEIASLKMRRRKQEVLESLARNGGEVVDGMVYLPPITNMEAVSFIIEEAKADMFELLADFPELPEDSIEEILDGFKECFAERVESYNDLTKELAAVGSESSIKYAVQLKISQLRKTHGREER